MSLPGPSVMPRSALPEAVSRLLALPADLVALTRTSSAEAFFEPVTSCAQVDLGAGNSLVSPVSRLFAPCEEMFSVLGGADGRPVVASPPEPRDSILFGIRPCDVAAVVYLDRFFLEGDFEDSLYAARRRRTRLVAVACDHPAHEHCFCSCCESGPVAADGYDVQLSSANGDILVEVATESGAEMTARWSDLLRPATAEHVAQRDEAASRLHTELSERGNMPAAIRRVSGEVVPEEVWRTIGERCISCGGCSRVCPKCTCFHVVDEALQDGTTARTRYRDSCRLAGFTREASGVNPREQPETRAQRAAYRKLSRRYMERLGGHGCVGCGRCAIVCMGGVDMPQVAQMIRKGV